MKGFLENRIAKFVIALIIMIGNVAFYSWGAPESGAKAAAEVHLLFYFMWQSLFLVSAGAFIYFGITKT